MSPFDMQSAETHNTICAHLHVLIAAAAFDTQSIDRFDGYGKQLVPAKVLKICVWNACQPIDFSPDVLLSCTHSHTGIGHRPTTNVMRNEIHINSGAQRRSIVFVLGYLNGVSTNFPFSVRLTAVVTWINRVSLTKRYRGLASAEYEQNEQKKNNKPFVVWKKKNCLCNFIFICSLCSLVRCGTTDDTKLKLKSNPCVRINIFLHGRTTSSNRERVIK